MGETIIKEPVAGEPGATEPPAQPASEPKAESSAVDEESLKAILEPLVTAEVERRTQSVKDKRIAQHEGRIDGLEDTLAKLKELQADGLSEKFAIEFLQMKESLASQGQQVPTEVPPEGEPAAQPQVAVEDYLSPILNTLGLKDTDASVIEIIRTQPNDPVARILAITKLAEARKQAQPTPANQAATLPSSSGQAIESETLESVTAELEAEMAKTPTEATRKRIRELGKKSKELIPKQ